MRIIFFVSAMMSLAMAAIQPAYAETGTDCASVKDDTRRLLCYDLVFKIIPNNPKVKDKGEWGITEEISKIDDTKNITIRLESTDQFTDKFSRPKKVTMLLLCRENKTSAYFHFPDTFVSDNSGYGDVTMRIDKNKAFEKSMSESTNNRALGLWSGGRSIPFIKSLYGKTSLLLRFTPYNESSSTVTFNIAGIENAIKPLAKACNWS